MEKVFGTIREVEKNIKKYDSNSWCLPNIYVDLNGNICYDLGHTINIKSLKELHEYEQMHRDVMSQIRELYKGVIMSLYREKFSSMSYETSQLIKLRDEARKGKPISYSKIGSFQDAYTFGSIINSIRSFEYRPYKEISEVMQTKLQPNRARYLFPIFTENGVKTNLIGRNLETSFQLITQEEADELRRILSGYVEPLAIPTGNRLSDNGLRYEIKYTPYQDIIESLFKNAEIAGRAIQMQISPTERDFDFAHSEYPQILTNAMQNMEKLGQFIFSPDFTKFIKKPVGAKKVSDGQVDVPFDFQGVPTEEHIELPESQEDNAETSTIDRIIMDGKYVTEPEIFNGRVVTILSPTGTEFRLVKQDRSLEVTNVSETNGQQRGE